VGTISAVAITFAERIARPLSDHDRLVLQAFVGHAGHLAFPEARHTRGASPALDQARRQSSPNTSRMRR